MEKIIVDSDRCIRCGACVGTCSQVFEFADDDYGCAQTKEENNILEKMDEATKEDALDALEGCPTSAIQTIEVEEKAD